MLIPTARYQKGLTLERLFPSRKGFCACGCGKPLTGRRRKWATDECCDRAYIQFAIIKGDTRIIREELFKRDQGFCYCCGQFDSNWQADHIIPVKEGGGATGLHNFQTLCQECHKEKTHSLSHQRAISSQASSTDLIRRLNDLGAETNCPENTSKAKHILKSAV
jgi:5-methylcytosine-specific restriction endonuclease McrA